MNILKQTQNQQNQKFRKQGADFFRTNMEKLSSRVDEAANLKLFRPETCLCHTREIVETCPLLKPYLSFLASSTASEEDAFDKVFNAIKKSKVELKPLQLETFYMKERLQTGIKCIRCKEIAIQEIDRLVNDPKLELPLEVTSPKQDRTLLWKLMSVSPAEQKIAAKLILPSTHITKKKESVTPSSNRSVDEKLLYKQLTSNCKNHLLFNFPELDGPLFYDYIIKEYRNANYEDPDSLLDIVKIMEELLEVLWSGFSFQACFSRQIPVDLREELIKIYKLETTIIISLTEGTDKAHDLNDALIQLNSYCDNIISIIERSNFNRDCMNAIEIGLHLASRRLSSSFIFKSDNLSFYDTVSFLLRYVRTSSYETRFDNLAMHCNKVYRELLDSVMTWKRSLTSELLMMFYGDMMHLPVTDKEVESLRATIIDSKKRYRFVRVNVMRIYGFNRMPLENLDNMAADFWDAYLKHETWINSLQVLHEQPPDLKFAFQTQSHLKFYSHIFGELNWILSRLSDAPKCQKLPDETINTCLSHVIGQLLLKEASQIIDETRRNQEEAEKKRQKDAEEAEADLLQSLKITDEQMKKNKKKKSNTQTNSKINITTPSPASASSTIFVKEESNQEPKIDNVPSQSTLKTPNILDHEDNDDERDPGEWETTSSKKKASKTLSSSSTFIENWISKSICEVRISEEFSHLILGENRKRIVDIVKSTGSQIKISDELLNGFRTFRVAGRPFENPSVAAENAQKTVSEMKYRLDHDGWGPMDIENRFEVLNSSIPIIFGTHKKNRMYQMDCLIYIEPVPSSTKTKFLFIRGLLVHVESATKIFQKYAVSSTVTFDSDNHFSPQRNSFPEDEKLKEEAKNASKTVASQQVEDMDEEFLRVLQLSAQEEEFRKRNEEEKKRQEEKHLDEEKTTQNELSKEIQEMEDSKLARALMEEEEKQHSLSLSSVPSSPKKTLAAMNTSQHTQRKNIQNQTSALNPTVKPILQEVPFNNYIENWKDDHLVIQMPQAFFGKVMGSSGSTLKQIEKESKTKIEYFKDLDEKQLHNRARRFFIHGNRNNIAYCVRRMKEEIGEDKTFMLPRLKTSVGTLVMILSTGNPDLLQDGQETGMISMDFFTFS